ncbi:MAG: N-acetylmuramoyl-L-alanine amidase [Candidatus Brocadiia bacterium]
MKTLKFIISILAVLAVLSAQSAVPDEKVSYVPLNSLAEKYNLAHEKDSLTGREIFSGNGYILVASIGMSSMLVNEKLAVLNDRIESVDGEIAVSARDIPKVELLLTDTSSHEPDDKSKKTKRNLKKIVIDPGHGGSFRGCKGVNGLIEKTVTLDVSKRLKTLLEKEGIKVVLTRERDTSLSHNLNDDLQRRADVANREQADLFLSIHCNWSSNPSIEGFEIYYCDEKNSGQPSVTSGKAGTNKALNKENKAILAYLLKDEYKSQTMEIAKEVKSKLNDLPTEDRGIKKANFRVIKQTKCPAILVEMDFISNKKKARSLSNEEYRQEVASKLKEAIISYDNKLLSINKSEK